MFGRLSFGSLFGYIAGNFCKQITDELIWYGGMFTLAVGGLTWMGWVTINFGKIDKDLLGIY